MAPTSAEVADLLFDHSEWSNRRIAATLGTYHSRVSAVRQSLVWAGIIPPIAVRIFANGRIVNTDHKGNVNRIRKENGGADLAGHRFGRLFVLRMAERDAGRIQWLCRCDCGKEVVKKTGMLTGRGTRSCGCLLRQSRGEATRTHGKTGSRAHNSWSNMRQRCLNPRNTRWEHYGGRGITVCERWQTFEAFYADMGDPPEGHSLDRINVDGDYEPSNCRWATDETQARNTRTNRQYTFDGQTMTMKEWSDALGINYWTLRARLRAKSFEDVARDLRAHS